MDTNQDEHYYGGQAVIAGVMMRGTDRYAVAVRRQDGQVYLLSEPLTGYAAKEKGWHRWPLIRGNYALIEALSLGMKGLQFSAQVVAQEEEQKLAAQHGGQEQVKPATGLSRALMVLTMGAGIALGLGLFALLPTWVVGLIPGTDQMGSIAKNVIEGLVRLLVVVAYILAISLMPYVRRVFEYHGAEHATINCFEAGQEVTAENCVNFSPLHPRCGTAFILLVIVVKIVVNCFLGWPVLWLRLLLRLAVLPPIAAISYEILRYAGRHRSSLLAQVLAGPGLLLQMLTTRRPDYEQIQTAIYALAAVAPEVSLSATTAPAQPVSIDLKPINVEGDEDGLASQL